MDIDTSHMSTDTIMTVDGVLIYQARIGTELRWLVQCDENKGTSKTLGDSVHATESEAIEYARIYARQQADRAARMNRCLKQEAADAARNAERQDIDGFLADGSAMARGMAVRVLGKSVKFNGILMSRRDMIRQYVASGATIQCVHGTRRLVGVSGSYLEEGQTTKIGMDYAAHLISVARGK